MMDQFEVYSKKFSGEMNKFRIGGNLINTYCCFFIVNSTFWHISAVINSHVCSRLFQEIKFDYYTKRIVNADTDAH